MEIRFIKFNENNFSNAFIRIYHTTETKKDAESILANGFDIHISRRVRNEGEGMGAFFEPNNLYGNYCIEFEISKDNFRKYILIDISNNITKEFCKEIHGYVKSMEDQVKDIDIDLCNSLGVDNVIDNFINREYGDFDKGDIKGLVQFSRFGVLSIHLYDPSIAKAKRIIEKISNE